MSAARSSSHLRVSSPGVDQAIQIKTRHVSMIMVIAAHFVGKVALAPPGLGPLIT